VKQLKTKMDCSKNGKSCYAHHICGSLLAEDVVVCFRRLQILVDGKEKSVIDTYQVLDGIDSCWVGFLKSKHTRFSGLYKGMLIQLGSLHPDSPIYVFISCLPEETIKEMTINRVDDTESKES